MNGIEVRGFGRMWMERLGRDPLAVRVIDALWRDREAYAVPVIGRARREDAEIDVVIEGDQAETMRHVLQHFRALLSLPTDRAGALGDDPLDFVRAHGVRRARMAVSLRAVLQAYRTGHKSFWAAICDKVGEFEGNPEIGLRTTMLLSEYLIDYTDLISIIVTDAYMAEEALLAAQRTRLSMAVLEELLQGQRPRSAEGAELCAQAGIRDGRALAILVARSRTGAAEAAFPARERSALAQQIEAALPCAEFGCLIEARLDEVTAIISAPAEAAARATQALRGRLAPADTIAIGLGLDVEAIGFLPRAYAEAAIAVGTARNGQKIAFLGELGVEAYLRYRADDTARRLVPAWSAALLSNGLAATLEAFAAADLNVKACANRLKIHNNTVYHRLNRVQSLTGIDPRSFAGLQELLAVLSVSRGPIAPPQASL